MTSKKLYLGSRRKDDNVICYSWHGKEKGEKQK